MNEEKFKLTPMMLFKMALKDAGLIKSEDDPRAHNAWCLYEYNMKCSVQDILNKKKKQNDLPA